MIDIRPQFRAPTVDQFVSARGQDPFETLFQSGFQGFQQGRQMKEVDDEKKRRLDAVNTILSTHPELKGFVTIDNVHEIAPALVKAEFERKVSPPMRNLYRDPNTGLFTDQVVKGADPYSVSPSEAVNTLTSQSKQDALQARLDEQIKARLDADKIRNENMAKNRIARLIIAQFGRNFKADKANMDNVIKSAAGLGFNLNQDDVLNAYQDVTGEDVTPKKTPRSRVTVSNFTVTP